MKIFSIVVILIGLLISVGITYVLSLILSVEMNSTMVLIVFVTLLILSMIGGEN